MIEKKREKLTTYRYHNDDISVDKMSKNDSKGSLHVKSVEEIDIKREDYYAVLH